LKEKVLGVIPARLNSSRLPQKPLFPLLGKPLLYWVWSNALQMKCFDKLLIATDSLEIAGICEEFGASVELTSQTHRSGTDRVAEIASKESYKKYRLIVNVQGDLPLLEECCLEDILTRMVGESWDVGTCGTPFLNQDEWGDPSKVKLKLAPGGRVECFFRIQKPLKEIDGIFRHIGVYVYTRKALSEWASAPPNACEELQNLEQLRALGIGLTIGSVIVPEDGGSVDTLVDARLIEKKLTKIEYFS